VLHYLHIVELSVTWTIATQHNSIPGGQGLDYGGGDGGDHGGEEKYK